MGFFPLYRISFFAVGLREEGSIVNNRARFLQVSYPVPARISRRAGGVLSQMVILEQGEDRRQGGFFGTVMMNWRRPICRYTHKNLNESWEELRRYSTSYSTVLHRSIVVCCSRVQGQGVGQKRPFDDLVPEYRKVI